MHTNEKIVTAFTALSHKRRVLIFRTLQKEGAALSFGALMMKTGLSSTTLNHHLNPMIKADAINRRTRGSFSFLSLNCADWMAIIGSIVSQKPDVMSARRLSDPRDQRPNAY